MAMDPPDRLRVRERRQAPSGQPGGDCRKDPAARDKTSNFRQRGLAAGLQSRSQRYPSCTHLDLNIVFVVPFRTRWRHR